LSYGPERRQTVRLALARRNAAGVGWAA
jgi:hypothetical protein